MLVARFAHVTGTSGCRDWPALDCVWWVGLHMVGPLVD